MGLILHLKVVLTRGLPRFLRNDFFKNDKFSLQMMDFSFFCLGHLTLYALQVRFNRLYSVVVKCLAFRPEIAGSNPVSAKIWSLFNFLSIS